MYSVERFIFTAVLCALALSATVEASGGHHSGFYSNKVCYPPREGLWQIVHNFPATPFDPELLPPGTNSDDIVVTVIANITITQSLEHVYNGTGTAETFLPAPASNVPAQLIGIFDPLTCMFSGTAFNNMLFAAATFRWHSGATRMSGPYVVTVNGTYPVALSGIQVATWIE